MFSIAASDRAPTAKGGLSPKAAVGVFVHELEESLQGFHLRPGRIAMPFSVRPVPEHPPDIAGSHVAGLGNPFINMLPASEEIGPHQKEDNVVPFNPLTLPNLSPQMKRRPVL